MGIFKNFLSKRKEAIAKKEAKRQEIFLKVKEVLLEQFTLPSTTEITPATRLIDDLRHIADVPFWDSLLH
jgi:hypothetical protein